MSLIISHNVGKNMQQMLIFAADTRMRICDTDLDKWIIDITGEPDKPFISSVRLTNCTIIADNLKSFADCFFDDSCEMIIKNHPMVKMSACSVSINNNVVPG